MPDLLTEVARRDAKRDECQYGIEPTAERLADIARALAPIVADVLDILSADGRIAAPVEPGPCWHDSGVNIPTSDATYRCELKAGHLGAHECGRGNGHAVWPADTEVQR